MFPEGLLVVQNGLLSFSNLTHSTLFHVLLGEDCVITRSHQDWRRGSGSPFQEDWRMGNCGRNDGCSWHMYVLVY